MNKLLLLKNKFVNYEKMLVDRLLKKKNNNNIKVIFYCNWKDNSHIHLLKELKMLTPNNSGTFKNLIGTDNLKEADIVVFLEGIPKNFNNIKNKLIICYPREPFDDFKKNWEKLKLKYGFTYNNFYHVLADPMFLNKTYDYLINLKYDTILKNKNLSVISSGKSKTTGHMERKSFVIKLSNILESNCDIYGSKWNGELNKKSYHGELGFYHNEKKIDNSKFEGLISYKYSICIENIQRKNYFSEKFTDSILCYTIPIYFGCPNINDYFPKDCYYLIDINDKNVFLKIKEIINTPITDKNIKALEIARDLILNKYNIWSSINDNLNKYLNNF